MSESLLLNSLLFIGFVLAPLMANQFFLHESKTYANAHKTSLVILLCGSWFDLNYAAVIWPIFCVSGLCLYIKQDYKSVFSVEGVACYLPFIFSLISSLWFVAGTLDWHLLGYNKAWSFYAALHGTYLGWLFVGCLAFLSKRDEADRIYLLGCYLSFLFFLLVAFGIDGVPYIKRVGGFGFSLMMPCLIGYYAFHLKKNNRLSKLLSFISLFSIFLSMAFALLNELWTDFPRITADVSTMVLTHGLLNALLAVPCFFLAIAFEREK